MWAATRRIGLVRTLGTIPVDPAIHQALDEAAARFEAQGCTVEPVTLDGLERAPNVWAFFFAELANYEKKDFLAGREDEAHWSVLENLKNAPVPDARQVAQQFAERERLRHIALDKLEGFDALLTPPARFPLFATASAAGRSPDSPLACSPALPCLPFGTSPASPRWSFPGARCDGLPVGVQLVGAPFRDEAILSLGAAVASSSAIW